jgi:glycerol-3-phosphate dehydrogenase (NAD+)
MTLARSVGRRVSQRRTLVRLPERRCDPLLASSAGEGGREGALRVAFVGSGNWGSAAAWIAAQNCLRHDTFNDTIRMFVHEETVEGAGRPELREAWKVVEPHLVDGRMDTTALQLAAAEVGVAISKTEAEVAIGEMDQDESGWVSQQEFFEWWDDSGKSNIGRLLSSVINRQRENIKYLPGIKLGDNVRAIGNLESVVVDADLLVFVTPHQFIIETCRSLRGLVKPDAKAISLIKGMEITPDGFNLISNVIKRELGLGCSVLMGANIAAEVAEGKFSEATIGAHDASHAAVFRKLFHTNSFNITSCADVAAVEMCGTLKNVVALGAGFVDGLGYGNNAKAAIMRVGFAEMRRLILRCYPETHEATFMESCGVADLITSCYGGRNRLAGEAFVHGGGRKSFGDIEDELLGGQKLQGALTSHEVGVLVAKWEEEKDFPLFTTIQRICEGEIPPSAIVRYAELPRGLLPSVDASGGRGGRRGAGGESEDTRRFTADHPVAKKVLPPDFKL